MPVADPNQKTVLHPPLVIQSTLQNQLAGIGDGESLEIFDCPHQPKS